jgi:hypothetical protein
LFEDAKKHLEERGETYFEHMQAAASLALMLAVVSLKCVVHSVFPNCYKTCVSDSLSDIEKMTKR